MALDDSGGPSLVSVVMAVYNGERYVGEAIRSVLSQDWPHIEVIVVDDGSTDGTHDVIAAIADPRIRYFQQNNAGVARARNVAIEAASGDYVAFLDADDIWLPFKTTAQVAVLAQRPEVGLVYGGYVITDEGLQPRSVVRPPRGGTDVRRILLTEANGIGLAATGMVRRDVLVRTGNFDPRLSTSADAELLWRIARVSEIAAIPQPLALYRNHGTQMHRDLAAFEHDIGLIIAEVFAADGPERRYHDRAVANLHVRLLLHNLARGNGTRARHSLGQVLRTRPFQLLRLPVIAARLRLRRRLGRPSTRARLAEELKAARAEVGEVGDPRQEG